MGFILYQGFTRETLSLTGFWYQKMSHFFLITHKKFYGQKVFPWEDSSENVTKVYPNRIDTRFLSIISKNIHFLIKS